MRVFRWLNENEPPPASDLRACGWQMLSHDQEDDDSIAIADVAWMGANEWVRFLSLFGHEARRMIILVGVGDASERARLLRLGFGEVLGGGLELTEVEARAMRLSELEDMLPRFRQIGRLRLDLLAREAFVKGDPIGLHPREFGLMWRLSDRPGRPLSKRRLIEDVWHMRFVPETNSLAVHVSRLRSKLRLFGLADIIKTTRAGEYVIRNVESRYAEPTASWEHATEETLQPARPPA